MYGYQQVLYSLLILLKIILRCRTEDDMMMYEVTTDNSYADYNTVITDTTLAAINYDEYTTVDPNPSQLTVILIAASGLLALVLVVLIVITCIVVMLKRKKVETNRMEAIEQRHDTVESIYNIEPPAVCSMTTSDNFDSILSTENHEREGESDGIRQLDAIRQSDGTGELDGTRLADINTLYSSVNKKPVHDAFMLQNQSYNDMCNSSPEFDGRENGSYAINQSDNDKSYASIDRKYMPSKSVLESQIYNDIDNTSPQPYDKVNESDVILQPDNDDTYSLVNEPMHSESMIINKSYSDINDTKMEHDGDIHYDTINNSDDEQISGFVTSDCFKSANLDDTVSLGENNKGPIYKDVNELPKNTEDGDFKDDDGEYSLVKEPTHSESMTIHPCYSDINDTKLDQDDHIHYDTINNSDDEQITDFGDCFKNCELDEKFSLGEINKDNGVNESHTEDGDFKSDEVLPDDVVYALPKKKKSTIII